MSSPVERKEFLVFGAPLIEDDEVNELLDSIRRRWIGTGPKVAQFEQDFAAYKGREFAVAVSSCTAALHLALLASGIGPGDEVITTPMTFCATVNAIIHAGATPVLVDCQVDTMNIDPAAIEARIGPKTKAILIVHFAGRCCDMERIAALARAHRLLLIEDCAHAIESEYQGGKAGSFGEIGCFSFYATKNVVTGEGGMVITDDEAIAARIKMLALHGMSRDAWRRFSDSGYRHYEVMEAGFKYNMMDLQAALGIHQLKRVDRYWRRRQAIWDTYMEAFGDLPCVLPAPPEPGTRHAYHLFTPMIDVAALGRTRDWVLQALTAENIGVGVHYIPVHLHRYYQERFGWLPGEFPSAEWIGERTLSLPLSPGLSDADVADVCRAFRKVLGQA
jgi:dTDP-4-amino-4,6-dideoxygalactose transaminase